MAGWSKTSCPFYGRAQKIPEEAGREREETGKWERDGSAHRRRADEGREQGESSAVKVDSISALPEELRLHILTFLPLKFAIRTAALSRAWRGLWERRWPDPSSLHIDLVPGDSSEQLLASLKLRERRRVNRFSLTVNSSTLSAFDLSGYLNYAIACRAEDLRVGLLNATVSSKLAFHFPKASPLLARLSLRRTRLSNRYYKNAQPFSALEVIHLHSVTFYEETFGKMVALCPCLRVLDLRCCRSYGHMTLTLAGTSLRSLTVAECATVTGLDVVPVSSLRSFRYRGAFLSSFYLPGDDSLADLYISFEAPSAHQVFDNWFNNAFPNLSNLTVLTICSNALQIMSSLSDRGAIAELAKLSNLQRLRELQLLMFEMKGVNLDHIYLFLKNCRCPNLERLFVQLPAISDEPYMENFFDEVKEVPPEDGLESLTLMKIMNFSWDRIEVQLVSFLLRRASSLHTLLVVSPKGGPLKRPHFGVEDLLIRERASANAQIILKRLTMLQPSRFTQRTLPSFSCQSPVELWPYSL